MVPPRSSPAAARCSVEPLGRGFWWGKPRGDSPPERVALPSRGQRQAAVCLLLLGALVLGSPLARAQESGPSVLLASDSLEVSGAVPAELATTSQRLLDALIPEISRRLGIEPAKVAATVGRLRLVLYPGREGFLAAQPRDRQGGLHRMDAGGWTDFPRGPSHVWLQAEVFDTRRLILHELTHQILWRLEVGGGRKEPDWLGEGLAEWMGWHAEEDGTLRLGAVDALSRNGLSVRARAAALDAGFDPWFLIAGRHQAPRNPPPGPEESGEAAQLGARDALALVHGLLTTPRAPVAEAFARALSAWAKGRSARSTMREELAPHAGSLAEAIREAWRQSGPRMAPLPAGWTVLGANVVHGTEGVPALETLPLEEAREIRLSLRFGAGSGDIWYAFGLPAADSSTRHSTFGVPEGVPEPLPTALEFSFADEGENYHVRAESCVQVGGVEMRRGVSSELVARSPPFCLRLGVSRGTVTIGFETLDVGVADSAPFGAPPGPAGEPTGDPGGRSKK